MEKEEEITNLKRRLTVVEHEIEQYEHMANFHFGKVQDYKLQKTLIEQELAELQKPKYTAKDFPCLDWNFKNNEILYNDGIYDYYIKANCRNAKINSLHSCRKSIDSHIDIIECKLSDIKPGDYFALNYGENKSPLHYRYCTKIDKHLILFDYGSDGYIKSGNKSIETINELKAKFVKFILKDK